MKSKILKALLMKFCCSTLSSSKNKIQSVLKRFTHDLINKIT